MRIYPARWDLAAVFEGLGGWAICLVEGLPLRVAVAPRVAFARFERPLAYADLRHADGYAVKLKGITTTLPAAAGAAKARKH